MFDQSIAAAVSELRKKGTRMRSRIQSVRYGFTLVELLVVISIIALLLAIMAPALNRARDKGKAIVCRSNLHQLGLSWSLYLQDNQQRFPWCHEQRAGGIAGTWPDWTNAKRRLTQYQGNAKVWRCPADRGYGGITSCFNQLGCSYVYNARANLTAYGWGLANKTLASLKTPSYLTVMGDSSLITYWNCQVTLVGFMQINPGWWHDRKQCLTNVVFADLHADNVLIVPTPNAYSTGGATDPKGKWTMSAGWFGPLPPPRTIQPDW